MTGLILDVAAAALREKTGIPEIDAQKTGNLNGRKATHWTFALYIAGSIVGVIAAIAGFLLGGLGITLFGYVIGTCGVLLGLIGSIAAFYIKRFAVFSTLEGYVKTLAERLKLLTARVFQLKETNQQLEKVSLGIKEIPSNWHDEIASGRKQLEERTKELQDTIKRLELVQRKNDQLALIIQELQKHTHDLSQATLDFSKENGFAGENIEKLQGEISKLDKENDELIGHISNLDAQNDQTQLILEAYVNHNKTLQDLHGMMQEMHFQAKIKMQDLEKEVALLKTVVPKAAESSEQVSQIVKEYQRMIEGFKAKENEHAAYKEGYTRWQTFVKSVEYAQYMKWKRTMIQGNTQ